MTKKKIYKRQYGFNGDVRDCMVRSIREKDCENCPEELKERLECDK